IPAWFTLAVLVFDVSWRIKLVIAAVLAVTFASPAAGLLAVAALAPLNRLMMTALDTGAFRIGEAIVLAFLVAWVVRAMEDRRGPRVAAPIGWLFALTIVVSVALQAWQLAHYPGAIAETSRLLF